MQIDVSTINGATVIRPRTTRIAIGAATELRTVLLDVIGWGARDLVVDLVEVTFIDSSGLGALVSALKTLRTSGNGDIRLANLHPSVVELLEIIRLNRVFASYASVELATRSFSSRP